MLNAADTATSWASCVVATVEHDDDGVHPATVLLVEVGVDHLAGRHLDALDATDLDVLLEGDLEVVDAVLVVVDRPAGRDGVSELLGRRDEVRVLGDEVGLALELDDGRRAVGRGHGDDALGVLPVRAVDGLGEALLAKQLGGGLEVAVGLLEGALRVHHPGPGGLAEVLDVLGGERHGGRCSWCVR